MAKLSYKVAHKQIAELIGKERMMEALLIALTLVASFYVLVSLHRMTRLLTSYPVDQAPRVSGIIMPLMSSAGKWLTVAGGVATFPLVMALTFIPSASSDGIEWVVPVGIAGCLALLLAAALLVPACISQCVIHKVRFKAVMAGIINRTLKPWLKTHGLKAALVLAGALMLGLVWPYVVDLVTGVAYVAALVIAGRLGLLEDRNNNVRQNYFDEMFKYSDDCASYDFYTGSNFYGTYPDD